MGISGFLTGLAKTGGAAAPVIANMQAAKQQAAAQGLQQQRQQLLQMLAMQMQERQRASQEALQGAQMRHYDAETKSLQGKRTILRGPGGQLVDATDPNNIIPVGPKPAAPRDMGPAPGTPEFYDMKKREAQIAAQYGYHPPVQGSFTPFQGTDKDGNPIVRPFNTRTGQFGAPADVFPKAGGGGAGGGFAQNMQARLLGAVSEGRLADQRMTDFETKHLHGGKLDVGTMKAIGGQLSTGLVGSHNPVSIAIGAGSEGLMNAVDPDYQQYLRDARLIARAEQLMAARGGSESMSNDNAFLARGGANAPELTVRAAEKSRKALFGKIGAVMQTLTPEQAAKLEKGLDALQSDDPNFDYAKAGQEIFGHAPAGQATGNIDLREPQGAPHTPKPTKFDPDAFYESHKKRKGNP